MAVQDSITNNIGNGEVPTAIGSLVRLRMTTNRWCETFFFVVPPSTDSTLVRLGGVRGFYLTLERSCALVQRTEEELFTLFACRSTRIGRPIDFPPQPPPTLDMWTGNIPLPECGLRYSADRHAPSRYVPHGYLYCVMCCWRFDIDTVNWTFG